MKKLKRLGFCGVLLCMMALLLTMHVFAVSANPHPQEVKQSDGSVVTLTGHGDEFFHWIEDENGYVVGYNEETGNYCYAYLENGELMVGDEPVVGNEENGIQTMSISSRLTREDVLPLREARLAEVNAHRPAAAYSLMSLAEEAEEEEEPMISPITNWNPDLLVLLVEYSDSPFQAENDLDHYSNLFFGTEGKTVNNFYLDQSGDKFQFAKIDFVGVENGDVIEGGADDPYSKIEFGDGVVKVTLKAEYPEYDEYDYPADEGVREAFTHIAKYIDFTKYDWYDALTEDRRPKPITAVPRMDFHVASVIGGWEASNSPANDRYPNRIWAHAGDYWALYTDENGEEYEFCYSVDITDPNAPTLRSFLAEGELIATDPDGHPFADGIGTPAHELGHNLGLPDLYDTYSEFIGYDDYGYQYWASGGVGYYSVMGNGSWGATENDPVGSDWYTIGGFTPTGFDPWSKVVLGFATPTVIDASDMATIDLDSASDEWNDHSIYMLTSPVSDSQYFLIENRQLEGYDAGLWYGDYWGDGLAGGVLVWLVDEDVINANYGYDINNNRFHKGLAVVSSYTAEYYGIEYNLDTMPYSFQSDFFSKENDPYEPYEGYHSELYGERANFHEAGHVYGDGDPYADDVDCHPRTVPTGITMKVLSENGDVIKLWINSKAAAPTFTTDLGDACVYVVGEEGVLSVEAEITDENEAESGELTYQWYVSTTGTTDGTPIEGATEKNFLPPTDEEGDFYYYVVVTNTNKNVLGAKTATATSAVISVTVRNAKEIVHSAVEAVEEALNELEEGETLAFIVNPDATDEEKIETIVDGIKAIVSKKAGAVVDVVDTQVEEIGNDVYAVIFSKTVNGVTESEKIILSVEWKVVGVVTVTFNANGGRVDVTTAKTSGGKLASLPIPRRDGYTFDGWYTAAEGGTLVTTATLFTEDTTVYAHWTKKPEQETTSNFDYGYWNSALRQLRNRTFDITATAGEGGTISEEGTASVKYNNSITYTITPEEGYVIKSVTVDGISRGAISSYTFRGVKANHTISVEFEKIEK